jgi:hypothetical protein
MLAHNGMIQPGTILTPEAEGKRRAGATRTGVNPKTETAS